MMLFSLTAWFLFMTALSESNANLDSLTRYKTETHVIITKNEDSLKNQETNRFHTPASKGVILKGGSDLPTDFKGSGSADFAFTGESFQSEPFETKHSHNDDTHSIKIENKNNHKYHQIDNESEKIIQNIWNQNRTQGDVKITNYNEIRNILISQRSNQSNELENTLHKLQGKNKNQSDWTPIIFPTESNTNIFVNPASNGEDLMTNHSIKNIVTITTTSSPNIPNACQRRCHQTLTGEYNPMCGSDGITYTNPGKLRCAIKCGRSVTMRKYSTCGSLAPVI